MTDQDFETFEKNYDDFLTLLEDRRMIQKIVLFGSSLINLPNVDNNNFSYIYGVQRALEPYFAWSEQKVKDLLQRLEIKSSFITKLKDFVEGYNREQEPLYSPRGVWHMITTDNEEEATKDQSGVVEKVSKRAEGFKSNFASVAPLLKPFVRHQINRVFLNDLINNNRPQSLVNIEWFAMGFVQNYQWRMKKLMDFDPTAVWQLVSIALVSQGFLQTEKGEPLPGAPKLTSRNLVIPNKSARTYLAMALSDFYYEKEALDQELSRQISDCLLKLLDKANWAAPAEHFEALRDNFESFLNQLEAFESGAPSTYGCNVTEFLINSTFMNCALRLSNKISVKSQEYIPGTQERPDFQLTFPESRTSLIIEFKLHRPRDSIETNAENALKQARDYASLIDISQAHPFDNYVLIGMSVRKQPVLNAPNNRQVRFVIESRQEIRERPTLGPLQLVWPKNN